MKISKHIFHKGILQGEGKGEVKGQIKMLEVLRQLGILSEEQFHTIAHPLRRKLAELTGPD